MRSSLVGCCEARARQFLCGDGVPQPDEHVEARPRGAQLGAGDRHPAQRVKNIGVQRVGARHA